MYDFFVDLFMIFLIVKKYLMFNTCSSINNEILLMVL